MLFIALAAPIIFRTVRESNPLLPTVLSVNLEGQHGTLLAGSIVSNLLGMLLKVEMICAAALLLTIIVQWVMHWQEWTTAILRTAMFVAAVGFAAYDWWFIRPRIEQYRKQYIDHADEPEIANPAREQFDRYHRESVLLLTIQLALLLGMIIFSTNISFARAFLL